MSYQEQAKAPLPSGLGMNGLTLASSRTFVLASGEHTGDEPVEGGRAASALCTTAWSRRGREQAV